MPVPNEKTYYTYADYLSFEGDERMEIINGEIVMMASPLTIHQRISTELSRQLANFLVEKPCQVFSAPLDVRLFEKAGDNPRNVDTVVQPDILIVCDKNKIDDKGIKGAPDLVIEILSPSTQGHDCFIKLNLYQQAGVREYWIADPETKTVKVFLLDDEGIYRTAKAYNRTDTVKVNILNGCFIELSKVFPEEDIPIPPHAPQA